ncbi:CehA/McbA family metallohydrolase [Massilia sp. PAMC28688]|uniref:CehA/McbA family metallohydrolase n=1 Tax=Massilia sp. PAMC28688 TaxID=2861283 RepID=UPI001C631BDA|nr:CehA/McbA family metallohydrolase [Massilia sp. PAMC28688]QYF94880.1 CehA/McbA family metallohydrolase [Massilia sp. PAMC28688]
MQQNNIKKLLPHVAVFLALTASAAGFASELDHREFEASLHVPYKADKAEAKTNARTFTLDFEYPYVQKPQDVSWKLEIISPAGEVVKQWSGVQRLVKKAVEVKVRWAGRTDSVSVPDGVYQVRMQAVANEAPAQGAADGSLIGVEQTLAAAPEAVIEQSWDLQIGAVAKPAMPAFHALPTTKPAARPGDGMPVAMSAPAPASLPYTVYFANLHSQTNHSDGGGAVNNCSGSQVPLAAPYGPADAFAYAKGRGLDILMTSEHNHMYDGSSGSNTSASPTTAKSLYQAGLNAAASFNAANPNFLGVYGMEWGVINNGGHLNILNSPELLNWEYNSSGQLLGDTFTDKTDYAGLYSLMRQRGYIGQFNHPASSGQFLVNGVPLGYTADGDQAMVLCEVLNTSAFSTNTTETETGRSTYESGCKKALEAGFHIAFSTNQDNHCANWGASYTNRTGVLIPNGTPLTQASFVDALKARRVFATMDKNSQLVLTANGRIMGERFTNSGPLNLVANFANTAGQSAATVSIVEGVPGRNGTPTQLSATANTTITPAVGEHYYYAKVTQGDGKILWSAPVWVTQTGSTGGDTTKPTVSASQSGTSGTITLSATASDNVGVSKVEFYVDNVLKGTDTSAPYSLALDSTTLTNGSHSLTAKAFDAANNSTLSAPVSFSVNNTTSVTKQLVLNPGFESGGTSWTATSGVITNDSGQAARSGTWKAWLNGYGTARTDSLYQQVTIPSTVTSATLRFWLKVSSSETTTTNPYDTLKVQVRNASGTVLATLATYSNLNKGTSFLEKSFSLTAYKGQTVSLYFLGVEGSTVPTSFIIDDVTLTTQ